MSEPMITIKKADGTFAKVPLSEFKKMQTTPKTQAAASVIARSPKATEAIPGVDSANKGIAASADADQLPRNDNAKPAHHQPTHHEHKRPTHQQAAHQPIKHHTTVHIKSHTEHAKVAHHSAQKMSRADAGSLLEEKIPTKGHRVLFNPKREKQVEVVISKLGFNVAPDILGRLKSLVLAKLKDIKSEDEARELLSRSVKNGGLGLTEPQVEKVLRSCREAAEMEHGWEIDAPVLKGKTGMLPMVEPEELPAKPREVAPIPYNKIRGSVIATTKEESLSGRFTGQRDRDPSSAKASLGMTVGHVQDDISKLINQTAASEPVFKLNTQATAKKSMQDVSASAIEMGPVEEIKSTTLTDFRRLSGNPEEAARRLQQKMFNLQDESFVLYLDALSAYRASPLYGEYMRAVCQSLAERKSLANVLAMKNSIKLNEVMALVEMEKGL